MARLPISVQSGSVATGTSNKTILAITAPANQKVWIDRASISFDGNSPTASKILVQMIRTASGGSGSSAATVQKRDADDAESVQSVGAKDFSSPHSGTVVFEELVHPQSGYTAPEGLRLKGGETFCINVTAPAGVNCRARFNGEE